MEDEEGIRRSGGRGAGKQELGEGRDWEEPRPASQTHDLRAHRGPRASESPRLGPMLCCHCLEVLPNIEQSFPYFDLALVTSVI